MSSRNKKKARIRRMNMIRVSRVDVNWLEAGTFENPMAVTYGELVVHYFNGV